MIFSGQTTINKTIKTDPNVLEDTNRLSNSLDEMQSDTKKSQDQLNNYRDMCQSAMLEQAKFEKKQVESNTKMTKKFEGQEKQLKKIEKGIKCLDEAKKKIEKEQKKLQDYQPVWYQRGPEFKKSIQVAVTGQTRCGKSTFINTYRELESKQKAEEKNMLFAFTEHGAEGTMQPTNYEYDDKCTIWDLPGYGTVNFPVEKYIADMGLKYFNMLIVITCDAFKDTDYKILEGLKEKNVPHIVVRNKIDESIDGKFIAKGYTNDDDDQVTSEVLPAILEKHKMGSHLSILEEKYLHDYLEVRSRIEQDYHGKLYIISADYYNRQTYDFPQLYIQIPQQIQLGIKKRQKEKEDLLDGINHTRQQCSNEFFNVN